MKRDGNFLNEEQPLKKHQKNNDLYPKMNLSIYGCLWGAICGDAIGIRYTNWNNVNDKINKDIVKYNQLEVLGGGHHMYIQGQFGWCSELILTQLFSIIINNNIYDETIATKFYIDWFNSTPKGIDNSITKSFTKDIFRPEQIFDYNQVVKNSDYRNFDSYSSGFLIRSIITGIYCYVKNINDEDTLKISTKDCIITHSNSDCINMYYILVHTIKILLLNSQSDLDKKILFKNLLNIASINNIKILKASLISPIFIKFGTTDPLHYGTAIQNAFYYFFKGYTIETAILSTIKLGGSSDVNSIILGALYGAYYGLHSIPERWINTILSSGNGYGDSTYLRYENLEYIRPKNINNLIQKLIV